MKHQLHPDAWEAVDFNTVAKNNNTNDSDDKIVAKFKKNEKEEVETVFEDNNNKVKKKITCVKYKNKYYLIKRSNKKSKEKEPSKRGKKSLSLSMRKGKKCTYKILKPKNVSLSSKEKNKSNLTYLTTLIVKPKDDNKDNSSGVKEIYPTLSMSLFKINTWYRLYIGYTFLLIYLLIVIYCRSELSNYPINSYKSK
uniref:Unspecified product n=1 Tax=Strongyloides stercoralis TaxID=6248 RepID=A0A0K0EF86_STRER